MIYIQTFWQELIPLILCTAMLHPDSKERDKLLNILFNLIKKPDEEQRYGEWIVIIFFFIYKLPWNDFNKIF